MGKNVGDDLREGKPTLPLLLAMERGTTQERALIRQAIEAGDVDRLPEVIAAVRRTGSIEATRDAALEQTLLAENSLAMLNSSEYKDALIELCRRCLDRSS